MSSKHLLLRLAEKLVRTFYRLQVSGLDAMPQGGCLLVPNHITWLDTL